MSVACFLHLLVSKFAEADEYEHRVVWLSSRGKKIIFQEKRVKNLPERNSASPHGKIGELRNFGRRES